ncbi:osm1 [Symbiodinium microadriaticum]|nr:osm1 [Symbiodinium microadriaticum]CAE7922113.1 osm1 [Symbiodinium sp. KB8]
MVLASGGFGADFGADSLLATYRPDLLHLPTTNGEHCTGDAIKMGEAVGAATIDLEWVQVHPTGLVKPDDPDAKVKFLAAEALRGVGGIVLDANGDRFCNELGRRDYVTGEMWKNKPPFRLCLNKAAADEIIWHAKHYTGRGVMKFYASGEDLAKDMGVPLQKIVDAHQKHFEAAKKQEKDPDGGPFPAYPSGKTWDEPSGKTGSGKKFFHNIIDGSKVPTEPFYVAIITPVIHYCMGGLECTVDAECIDKKSGKVIPGLYVAGEAAGGIHGNNRLGGNSLLDCVVFGRVAGKAACKFTFGAGEKFKPCPPPGELKEFVQLTTGAAKLATRPQMELVTEKRSAIPIAERKAEAVAGNMASLLEGRPSEQVKGQVSEWQALCKDLLLDMEQVGDSIKVDGLPKGIADKVWMQKPEAKCARLQKKQEEAVEEKPKEKTSKKAAKQNAVTAKKQELKIEKEMQDKALRKKWLGRIEVTVAAHVFSGFTLGTGLSRYDNVRLQPLECTPCDAMRWDHSGLALDTLTGWGGTGTGRPRHGQELASFLSVNDSTLIPKASKRREGDFVSFFKAEDLAPPGGLPPPKGWGEGNDSPCKTCSCGDQYEEEGAEQGKVEKGYPKMVFPNVPHHSFFPHKRGYKLSQFKVFALFFAGLGCGYAAAKSLTQKEQPMELARNEEVAGARTAAS